MLVKTFASAVQGVDAQTITVEVNAGGIPKEGKDYLYMVGLPDSAVREGLARMEAAIKNIGLRFPRLKLVVNLAPADIRKEGSAYDLPIAMGILGSAETVQSSEFHQYVFMGELSLDGGLRPIKGALPIAIQARKEGYKGLFLPKQNAREAAIVNNLEVYGIENLREAVDFFNKETTLKPVQVNTREIFEDTQNIYDVDFSDVKGQENIKRA